jgi:hypothetical protein
LINGFTAEWHTCPTCHGIGKATMPTITDDEDCPECGKDYRKAWEEGGICQNEWHDSRPTITDDAVRETLDFMRACCVQHDCENEDNRCSHETRLDTLTAALADRACDFPPCDCSHIQDALRDRASAEAELTKAREYGDEWLKQIYRLEADLAEFRAGVDALREALGTVKARLTVCADIKAAVRAIDAALTPKEARDE